MEEERLRIRGRERDRYGRVMCLLFALALV